MTQDSRANIAHALRLIADAIDSEQTSPSVDLDAPMTIARIIELRPGVTAGWLRTHVAEAGRGARRTPLHRLADVDVALASGAQPPRPPRKSRVAGVNEDPIDAMIAAGELRQTRGQR